MAHLATTARTVHSPRPRRFRKTAAARARAAGYITTAAAMVRSGIPANIAERYAAQITKTAAKNGIEAAAITYRKHRGQWLPARAFDLATHGLRLLLTIATYRPAAPRRLKNGQPSKAKAELAKAEKLAAYTAAIGSLALITV